VSFPTGSIRSSIKPVQVPGTRNLVNLRLLDETLARTGQGISVQSSFTVKPGTYRVRVVVRESEGQSLSAHNVRVIVR
jgi:hypothetical protein